MVRAPKALEDLRRKLQTIETTEPRSMRLEVLRALQTFTHATSAMYVNYDIRDGAAHYAAPAFTAADLEHACAHFEGRPAMDGYERHLAPPLPERSRFVGQDYFRRVDPSNMIAALPEGSALRHSFYEVLGVRDEARALFFDGRRYVGRISLHHHRDDTVSPLAARLNRVTLEIGAVLREADRLEHQELSSAPRFVVRPNGAVEFASAGGEAWLTKERWRRLIQVVAEADRAPTFAPLTVIDGARASIVRMHGATTVYLISLAAPDHPQLPADRILTPRQQQIAEYAIAGATAREIAAALDLSFETVREHFKDIYRRLEVSSRTELVNALRAQRT